MAIVRWRGRRQTVSGVALSLACGLLVTSLLIPSSLIAGTPGGPEGAPPPAAQAFVDPGANVIARWRERIPRLMADEQVPGLAIAVVDGDRVLWSEAFGSTARDGGRPVTTDTIFSVQSMSKLFTATAVMRAVQEGRVDLDTPITTYLPEFTVHSVFEAHPEQRLTLRMLLAHTGGFTHEAPFGNNFDLGHPDFDAHVDSIADTWLRFPVGTGYAYSNLDIDLAGAILERVYGRPLAEVMDTLVLAPLGMTHSTFDQQRIRATEDRAVGTSAPLPQVPVDVPMAAAGGLYSSASDLARFLRFQLGDGRIDGVEVLSPALLEAQRTVPAPHEGAKGGYALGVERTRWRAERYVDLFSHGGGGFGFLSDLWWAPSVQLGIAVLTNSADHSLQGRVAIGVLRDLVDEPGSEYAARVAAQPVQSDVVDFDRFEPPAGLADRIAAAAMPPTADQAARWASYVGTYRPMAWGVVAPWGPLSRFLVDDGTAVFEATVGDVVERHRLVEVEPGLFLADDGEMLDLRGPTPTYRNIVLVPTQEGPAPVAWALLLAASAIAVASLVLGVVGWLRRRRGGGLAATGEPRAWRFATASVSAVAACLVLACVSLVAAVPGLVDSGFVGWLHLDPPVRIALHAPLALAIATGLLVALAAGGSLRGWWSPRRSPRLPVLAAAATVVTVELAAWRLIGLGLS